MSSATTYFSLIIKTIILFLIVFFAVSNTKIYSQTKEIDSLLKALSSIKGEREKIPILTALSIAYTSVDVDKKYYYSQQYLAIGKKYKIDSLIPMAYMDMGMKHGIQSHYDSSMYYFTKGLEIAKEKGFKKQEARAYVCIGYTLDRLNNPKAAIKNYELALAILKKSKFKRGLNQTYINLGSLYYDITEYKIAEDYFKEAFKIAQETKDKNGIAQGYFNLGGTSYKLGDAKKARQYYLKSLELREEMNDLNGIALASWGLGEISSFEGKYDEAQKYLDRALKNNRILQNKYQEMAVMITTAKNYLKQKNYKKAEELSKISLENSNAGDSYVIAKKSLENLIQIYQEKKDFVKAFDYQSQLIALNDSANEEKARNDLIYNDFKRMKSENSNLEKDNEFISNKNSSYIRTIYIVSSLLLVVLILLFLYLRKTRQKNKMNKILENQKMEIININKELVNLNKELLNQNDITKKQKEELEHINAVKNKFFSIVSHDLRSPISTLKMLFNSYSSGHLTREEMDVLLKKLEENIFDTADFLDNLLEWSKSQLEGMEVVPEQFTIKKLFDRNLSILSSQIVAKQIHIENNIDENTEVFADKNMINVVIRNLLSNGIKFCNPKDKISLNCELKPESVIILIKDTGIGIHPDEQKKIFKLEHTLSQGTSGEKGHHIGLVLCKDMMEQNNGKIWFESVLGEGTTFFVEIPLAKQ